MELRIAIACMLLVLISLFTATRADVPGLTEEQRRERLENAVRVNLESSQHLYKGLPCVVQLGATCVAQPPANPKIRGSDDLLRLPQAERDEWYFLTDLATRSFPIFDPFTSHPLPVSIRVEDSDAKEVIGHSEVSPLAFYTRHPGGHDRVKERPRITVTSGETRTWLLDLAPWISALKPGTYSITVRLHSWPDTWWESPRQEFEVVELDEPTRRLIEIGMPQLRGKEVLHQQDWLQENADLQVLANSLPSEVWSKLALYALVGRSSASDASVIDSNVMSILPERLRIVAELMRYELLIKSGEQESAVATRERVRSQRPDLAWMLDMADSGNGIIQHARELLQKKPAKGPND